MREWAGGEVAVIPDVFSLWESKIDNEIVNESEWARERGDMNEWVWVRMKREEEEKGEGCRKEREKG